MSGHGDYGLNQIRGGYHGGWALVPDKDENDYKDWAGFVHDPNSVLV